MDISVSGTKSGGMRAAVTMKERYGEDVYRRLGQKGGKVKTDKPKGFAANPALARKAGAKGGRRSKRGKAKAKED